MRIVFSFLFFLLGCLPGQGQVGYTTEPLNFKAAGYVKMPTSISSRGNNGALAKCNSFSASVYSEQLFSLAQFRSFYMALVMPTSSGVFNLQIKKFGDDVFADYKGGIGYARSLGKSFDVGVTFNYYAMALQRYGHSSTVAIDAGVLFHCSDNLRVGLQTGNSTYSSLGNSDKLPSTYSAALGYDLSDKLFLMAGIEKVIGVPPGILAIVEYRFIDKLFVKGGVATANANLFFGTGVLLNDVRIEALATFHPRLGVSPGLMISYEIKKN